MKTDFMEEIVAMRSADYDAYLIAILAILSDCNKKEIIKNLELFKDVGIENLISDAVSTIMINIKL